MHLLKCLLDIQKLTWSKVHGITLEHNRVRQGEPYTLNRDTGRLGATHKMGDHSVYHR